MSETQKIAVSNTVWTDISGSSSTGIFTNNSHSSIRYRISNTQPADNDDFGHILHPQVEKSYDLDGDEKLWSIGLNNDAKIALTTGNTSGKITNSLVKFDNGPTLDASGRLRTSEPFGVFENKNITSRNRNQWNEVISGAILEYNTLVGGPFTVAEEIRGTDALVPRGTINTDNGASSMNIDCMHNDFAIGMTITGQTSGATAVLTSTNTGSDIQHNYNHGSVNLTVGTGAGDSAFRQAFFRAAYVPGKGNFPTTTFIMAPQKTNVIQDIGLFDDLDGIILRQTESAVSIVIRSSTSGAAVETVIPQDEWTIDRLDGGASDGPNPSGITLDLTKAQYFSSPYLWQGVGPLFVGMIIDNNFIYITEVKTSNIETVPYIRNPSLPIRYEIRNTGVTASPTTLEEICATVTSEGGYTLPGLEFSASSQIMTRSVSDAALQPIFAIRLKTAFPAGKLNTRAARFLKVAFLDETADAYFEVQHIHDPIDITATWNDVSGGSAIEFSTDISAFTGTPSHTIDFGWLPTAQANKSASAEATSQFINIHSFINQNYNSTNSEMFVIMARSLAGTNALIRSGLSWIEFD